MQVEDQRSTPGNEETDLDLAPVSFDCRACAAPATGAKLISEFLFPELRLGHFQIQLGTQGVKCGQYQMKEAAH
jgi:hypothetical protein